jgi:hypothetical protein
MNSKEGLKERLWMPSFAKWVRHSYSPKLVIKTQVHEPSSQELKKFVAHAERAKFHQIAKT